MRNMSFALTTTQILEETKDVTRRLGWLHLTPGQWVRPVRKCMGLRPGERIEVLRDPLLIVDVRRERLDRMLTEIEYGHAEVRREGFGGHPDYREPSTWVAMFCATHKGCAPETVITRIEFAYREEA
jgi:putative ubiquitin-RnfH superfamily antitoxin RatB of RatAB toxin-antitoxin module